MEQTRPGNGYRNGLNHAQYNRVFDDDDSEIDEANVAFPARFGAWWQRKRAQYGARYATYSTWDWFATFLPCLAWLKTYQPRNYLFGDFAAGLSIGVMVVPQGMSYSLLAGLPAVYGLYGAFVPVLIYACFGSSPQLAVGPVAITSLLLGTGLGNMIDGADTLTDPNNPTAEQQPILSNYIAGAMQVGLLVGLIYVLVGILQLGFLANFLSHSVISGFTTGAAIIIACSQLKYFFGVTIPNTDTLIHTIEELAHVMDKVQWREMLMFSVWLVMLLGMKQVGKKVKKLSWIKSLGPITVCVIGIFFVEVLDLEDKIKIIGNIPSGMPPVTFDTWGPLFRGETEFGDQIVLALVVMLVGFMESISIAKALARRGKYHINASQEIFGLGAANILGSAFSAYTTTGSFSRSAVSFDVGAKTALFGIITSAVIMMVLLFLTPVFELVPFNAMGAIVVSACVGLFEGSEARFLYKANFPDFLVWVAAFLGTILLGVEIGLAIAIGLAILLVVYQSAFPHTATLGRLPGTAVYRSIKQYPSAQQPKGMLIMRVDAPIYFANVSWIRSRMEKYLERARQNNAANTIKFVIMDLAPVPFIDATGMHAFMEVVTQFEDEGIQLVLANPCAHVKAHLKRVHLLEAIGKRWVFVRTSDAVDACHQALLESNRELLDDDFAIAHGVEMSSTNSVTLPSMTSNKLLVEDMKSSTPKHESSDSKSD